MRVPGAMPTGLLTDKVVFLTGAGAGIGRECALAYAREGAIVALADIDRVAAEGTARELAREGLVLECDVSKWASVDAALQETVRRFSRLDAVHNNAGVPGASKALHETSPDEWDRVMEVNLKSIYLTTRSAFPALKDSKGCILNTASMVGLIGQTNHAAYVATKGGCISLTKAMAADYAPFKIRVNALCPAGIWTPMLRHWSKEQPNAAQIERYLDEIHLLGYCPEGDVVADAAVFLLSNKARFITGCILPVSGGAELGYRR
jgi:meso-butanediol dehydrogenase / (S,S)-butanediol dehydrogenase / diacetyl reductase